MKVQIQSVHFNADQKLIDFAQTKLDKLERFDDSLSWGEVILKLDKDNDNGNKVVVLKVSGDLTAERRATTFEEAIDEAIDAIKRQIERRRG